MKLIRLYRMYRAWGFSPRFALRTAMWKARHA